jgi:flagellar hook assembly protein FlgD
MGRVFPNPTRGRHLIEVQLAGGQPPAELRIYDMRGRLVWLRDLAHLPAGTHQVEWNGRDLDGRLVPPSVYFARVSVSPGAPGQKLIRTR